jgi:hypothetical protein
MQFERRTLSARRGSLLVVIAFPLAVLIASAAALAEPLASRGSDVRPTIVRLANGAPGIGFDDVLYDRAANRIFVPGGRSGNLYEIDPSKGRSRVLASGFSATGKFDGGHDFGITSVTAGHGLLFATDRTRKTLSVIKPSTRSVVATARLGAGPDIVRYVAATNELWVTEPDAEQIEVLSGPSARTLRPRHVAFIRVPGGPEALAIDQAHGVAYTNAAAAKTVVVELRTRRVRPGWTSGCKTPKEFAIDPKRELAFTACNEGGIYAIDLAHGRKVVGHVPTAGDVDFPAYAAALRHLYVESGTAKKVSVIAVAANGALTLLGTVPGALDSPNALADGSGNIWVPRPHSGDMMRIADPFVRRTG